MRTRIAFYACLAAGLTIFSGPVVAVLMVPILAAANKILDAVFSGKPLWKSTGESLAIRSLLSLGLVPFAWLACRILAGKGAVILLGAAAGLGLIFSLRRKSTRIDPEEGTGFLAIPAILAAVLVLTWLPLSRIGSRVDGQYAYRAYFSSDYLKHFSVVESLRTGSLPPPNLYFKGEPLHYYWLPYVVPALVSGAVGSTQKAMLGFSFCVNFLFLLLLLYAGQRVCGKRKALPYLGLFVVLAPSLEGLYIFAARAGFSPAAFLRIAAGTNVDGLTRWIWGLPQIDTALRAMLFTPQHLLSLAFLLIFLMVFEDKAENPFALSLALSLSLASSFFIGGLLLLVWGAFSGIREVVRTIKREQKPEKAASYLTRVFALPALVVGLFLILKMVSPGGSDLQITRLSPAGMGIELGLNFGLLVPAAAAVLFIVRFPGRGFQGLLLGVTLGSILFVRVVNFESDLSLKFGLVAGLVMALALCRLGSSSAAGRFAVPLALLVILPGLLTLTADVRNSADVHNRRFTSYIPVDEMSLLEWARGHVPSGRTVQNYPEGRTWNFTAIPPFSGRQMVVGDRSHGQIFQVSPDLYERRLEALRRAISGLPGTRDDLRRLGVDYLFWGEEERAIFKIEPGLPEVKRFGQAALYAVGGE